jgi:Mn2+/Fe2+ NRAMP family transporter
MARPVFSGVYATSGRLEIEMTKSMFVGLYVGVLIAVVVSVDLLFFRNRFWERLIVNIGVVLVFAAFYLRFLKNPLVKRRGIAKPQS